MQWNLAAEVISIFYLCIIWLYSRKGNPLPTLKNRIFQHCFLITFLAMASNILSTLAIHNYTAVPLGINWFITSFYYVATPLMGVVYFVYATTFAYDQMEELPRYFRVYYLPAILYGGLVMINPWTHWLFSIDLQNGYTRGPLVVLTYVVFYLYCLACLVITFTSRQVNRSARQILMAFPIVAAVTIIIQQRFPTILLSGSAATLTLLIIYLFLQNQQSTTDSLLNLPNRRCFLDNVQMLMRAHSGRPFFVAVFSLREFKQVNEQFGQPAGDEFLKEVAQYLQNAARPHRVYRYSGDEFAVLMEWSDQDAVLRLCQALYQGIKRPWKVQQYNAMLGAVVGIVKYPDTVNSANALITGIEHSVSYAKGDKNNDFCIFTLSMLETTKRQREIAGYVRDAYERDAFDVYFQPLWSIETQQYTVAESLLRMANTPLGRIYPSEFIPMAESTGLIIGITYQVLHKVCRFIRRAHDEGVKLDSVTVNYSTVQFTQPDAAQKTLDIIRSYDVPFSCIKIEITESAVVERPELLLRFVEEMGRYGVEVGMDDFGTGYCNLASVTTTPLDFVKIDKSMLWSAMESRKSSIMMRSLIHIIHQFGIEVVCEGVENTEQANFCIAAGTEWIQGYYYSHPLPADDALQIMKGLPAQDGRYIPAAWQAKEQLQ